MLKNYNPVTNYGYSPEDCVTRNAFIQNGNNSYSGRYVDIVDGVINFDNSSASSSNKSIFITKSFTHASGAASATTPPIGSLLPLSLINGANAVESYVKKNPSTTSGALQFYYCSVDEENNVTTLQRITIVPSGQNGMGVVSLGDLPAGATHFAMSVYDGTIIAGKRQVHIRFKCIPTT